MAMEESNGNCCCFCVGQRVLSLASNSSERGTVKYVGAVQGYEGVWVGVEWDSGQGRHNGRVNGIQYFCTQDQLPSGSLVRPNKLSAGVSLLDALSSRYKATLSQSEEDDMYVTTQRRMRVAVELVGKNQVAEHQAHLEMLTVATLAYTGVCSAGAQGEIRLSAPNITDLDLTGNLIPEWQEVGRICEELPALKLLDLSSSRIAITMRDGLPVLSNLTTLVLNHCAMRWKHVEVLNGCLPKIEELSLCGNKLQKTTTTSQPFVGGFESLRLLNLEDNLFDNWNEIVKLSQLQSLQQLYLSGNCLQQLWYPDSSSSTADHHHKDTEFKPFAALRCLLLAGNKISEWSSVDALDQFPALEEVRLSQNPLTDSGNGVAPRYMLIAHLGKITSLNGSQVKPRERRDAEIRYVRHVLSTMQRKDMEEIMKSHPRFEHLQVLHDVPMDLGGGSTGKTSTMASSLISVSIVCVAATIGERAPITKKLPSSTTIGRLKVVCEALFKLRAARQQLFFKDQDAPLPVALVDDMESLADLGFVANTTIIVDEVHD
ncbi:unnamed protein product [Sphagnum troendelagicum]|uniref:CAP-Gly domain-containing protein n=1 Tax=Sphagnum troendelagicum TaxID=128251 RepID=A0ABP0U875_9BRYO